MNYIMCLVDNDRIFQVDQLGRKEICVVTKHYNDTMELLKKFQAKAQEYKKMHEDTVRKVVESEPELQKYPFWCVYYVLNMMYADYYDPAFANPRTYIKLTKSFLNDKDAPKDKVRRYINAMKA